MQEALAGKSGVKPGKQSVKPGKSGVKCGINVENQQESMREGIRKRKNIMQYCIT